jgi:hypothetical protein
MDDTDTRLNDGEGLEIAKPEDFGIQRDEEGNLLPNMQRIPGTEKAIKVIPLASGAYDEWEHVLEENHSDEDDVDKLFRERIVEGIGSNGIENVPDYVMPGLVQAIKNSSGHEVFQAVESQQMEENLAAMEALDGMEDGPMGDVFSQFMQTAIQKNMENGDVDDEEAAEMGDAVEEAAES